MRIPLKFLPVILVVPFLSQCASIKPQGSSDQEKRDFIDKEATTILAKLEKQVPKSTKEIADAKGVVAFRYSSAKLPLILSGIGGGSGYGVAVDKSDKSHTYMKVQKFNWGLGMGARDNSVVFVFNDRKIFERFRKGKWDGGASAEATVKANDVGADVGGVATVKKGFTAYTLTESGLSYGVTYQTRRFTPIGSLNKN
jgi:lipid-binding SYLF domain-containing protein